MNFLSRVSVFFVCVFFFLTALVWGLASVISADNLKQTLKNEQVYEKIVPAVLDIAAQEQLEGLAQGSGASTDLPISEPWVRSAVEKAFPPSDIEQKGNSILDGTFAWLEGETEKPEFKVDFTANKQQLAQELSLATENRLASLPRCPRNQIASTVDAYKAECLPLGVSPSLVASRVAADVNRDQSVIKDPVITPENLDETAAAAEQGTTQESAAQSANSDPFENLQGLRDFYSNLGLFKWLFPVMALVLAGLSVYLAKDHRRAFKRLALALLSAGVGLLFLGVIVAYLLEKTVESMSTQTALNQVINPVFVSLSEQFRSIYLMFGVGAIVLATILLFIRNKLWPISSIPSKS